MFIRKCDKQVSVVNQFISEMLIKWFLQFHFHCFTLLVPLSGVRVSLWIVVHPALTQEEVILAGSFKVVGAYV